MQKIIPHLWFDNQAQDAVNFYVSIFPNSKIGNVSRYGKEGFEVHGQPEGQVMTVAFEIEGQRFLALNGGPYFKLNPSISFLVACKTKEEVNALWEKLSEEGSALMPLWTYPFSENYGWIQDKYGLSWQIMFMGDRPIQQKITPTLMFVGKVCGKAEEAANYYATVFHDTEVGDIMRYTKDDAPDAAGTVKYLSFKLEGQQFAAMDSAREHNFFFNEAVSFMVFWENQEEIDSYWDQLKEGWDPNSQQCGWLKDKYGVSWQIVPSELENMMSDPDKQKVERVTKTFLKMKKLDIAEIKKAYEGK